MKKYYFGRVQMRIMQVLWKKKRASAREITDALNEFEPIAHSTVQTLLRTLENKNAIKRLWNNKQGFLISMIIATTSSLNKHSKHRRRN